MGKPLSDEHKRKLSLALKGRKHSAEHNKKVSEALTGKKASVVHRKNVSKALTGRKLSEEHIKNMSGWNHTEEAKEKIRQANIGRKHEPHTEETLQKISSSLKGRKAWNKGIPYLAIRGENHPKWIKDRTQLAKRQERNDMAYKEWRKQVWIRDKYKCQMCNSECQGKIEAHHIVGWMESTELRYEIENGITLCHYHHPRTRKKEKELIPYFKNLLQSIKN